MLKYKNRVEAMSVFDANNNVITLKERTLAQITKYISKYLTSEEQNKFKYIDNSQFVLQYNGYTYADFLNTKNNCKIILMIYDNPELDITVV